MWRNLDNFRSETDSQQGRIHILVNKYGKSINIWWGKLVELYDYMFVVQRGCVYTTFMYIICHQLLRWNVLIYLLTCSLTHLRPLGSVWGRLHQSVPGVALCFHFRLKVASPSISGSSFSSPSLWIPGKGLPLRVGNGFPRICLIHLHVRLLIDFFLFGPFPYSVGAEFVCPFTIVLSLCSFPVIIMLFLWKFNEVSFFPPGIWVNMGEYGGIWVLSSQPQLLVLVLHYALT